MEFGDELILDSFKVPCLIWIQLVIMFLLFILLFFGVTLLTSDDSAAAPPPSSAFFRSPAVNSGSLISTVKDEDAEGEGYEGRGNCFVTEEDKDGDECSSPLEDPLVPQFSSSQIHPCSYMRIIFKCFGFDFGSKSSNKKPRDKRD